MLFRHAAPDLPPLVELRRRLGLKQLRGRTGSAVEDFARSLAHRVSNLWEHDHVLCPHLDANLILDRVAGGERFCCVDYAKVFNQALSACGVLSRNVWLQGKADRSNGHGHVLTEVYLPASRHWAVVDPQLSIVWRHPAIGLLNACQMFLHGDRAEPVDCATGRPRDLPVEWRGCFCRICIWLSNDYFLPGRLSDLCYAVYDHPEVDRADFSWHPDSPEKGRYLVQDLSQLYWKP